MNNLLGFQKSYLFFILVRNFSESSLSLSDFTTQMYVFLQWSFIYLFKANKLALRSIQAAFAEAASFAVEPKKKVRLHQIVHSSNYEYDIKFSSVSSTWNVSFLFSFRKRVFSEEC